MLFHAWKCVSTAIFDGVGIPEVPKHHLLWYRNSHWEPQRLLQELVFILFIVQLNSCVNWDGLCDHLRNFPLEDIFKLSTCGGAAEFCEWIQAWMHVYVSFLVNIRSSLLISMVVSCLYYCYGKHFFVCTN